MRCLRLTLPTGVLSIRLAHYLFSSPYTILSFAYPSQLEALCVPYPPLPSGVKLSFGTLTSLQIETLMFKRIVFWELILYIELISNFILIMEGGGGYL